MRFKKTFSFFLAILLISSCSLDYTQEENSESAVPEFTFENAVFNRFSENKISLVLKADLLEQYKSDGSFYAKAAVFETYDKEETIETNGHCGFLSAQTSDDTYAMFENVFIDLPSQELTLTAQSLFFNAKTEQLVCAADEEVSVSKKNTAISGTGFSASGVSKTFSFAQAVRGTIQEEETSADENPDEEENSSSSERF